MKRLWARLRAVDPLIADSALALCVLVPSMVGLTNEPTELNPTSMDAIGVLLTIVGVGILAVRRRYPLLTVWVTIATAAVYSLRDYAEVGHAVAVMIAVYTAAATTPRRRWGWALAAIVGFLVVLRFLQPDETTSANLVGNLAIFGIAAAFGDSNATRRANTEALRARAEALERNQAIEAERAVADERLRIARQLHDVVAHALAVIAVQSTAGSQVIDTRPDEAKKVLDRINDASRETLDEMRRMLGILRGDGTSGELAPAPGLGDLGTLVDGVRAAGVEVDVDLSGDEAIPAGVALTTYRIVQEALTNVLKHAGPAKAEVHIACDPGVVTIQVDDDGRGSAAEGGEGTHLGLIGMRERVAVYSGELEVGPRPGGGWHVAATLPYERVAS
jgi:signal transduction histidine kinase